MPDASANTVAFHQTPTASGPTAVNLGPDPHVQLPDGSTHRLAGKAAALMALAVLEPTVTRRRVALLLWPDSPETLARNNLRTLMHRLGKQLGQDLFGSGESLGMHAPSAPIGAPRTDEILDGLRDGGARRCELLAGIELDGLEEFQAWLGSARQRLRQAQLNELERTLAQAVSESDAGRAIAIARACVALEPLSERWHRQLMQTLATCGDRAAALAAYEDCKATLRENLGAVPDERTRSLHVRLLQSQHGDETQGNALRPATPAPTATAVALVERDAALVRLDEAWAHGRHMALQGEAGVGKTRLLHHFAEGRAVLVITLHADAHHEPYAALAQVLQQVQQRHALRLGRSESIELARVAPLAFPQVQPSSAGLSTARLRAALAHWAQRLHEQGVRLLALDDVHHADPQSQAALAGLLTSNDAAPPTLRLLLSHRSAEVQAPLAEAIVAAQVHKQLEVVALQRLSLNGIEALLRSLGHDEAAVHDAAQRLLQSTGGNPLFVIELTLFKHLEHIDGRLGVVGTNLQALLQSRLAGCSATARQLAAVAGVALGDFSVELAAALTEGSPLDLMPAWIELQARGLFSEHGLAHDLVREAVLATLPTAIRSALHRQVALHLERRGRAGGTVLHHWLAAQDCERAFPHAEQQIHQIDRLGLDALQHHRTLLTVIEGLSVAALIERLWCTAKLSAWGLPDELRTRFMRLIDRVEAQSGSAQVKAWVAFERSRLLFYGDGDTRQAQTLLLQATADVELPTEARCWVELMLSVYARQTGTPLQAHARRMVQAAAALPLDLAHLGLHRERFIMRACYLREHAGCVREGASDLRAARQHGDVGAQREARLRLAYVFSLAGFDRAATHHFGRVGAPMTGSDFAAWPATHQLMFARSAMRCGHFDDAIACFETMLTGDNALAPYARPYLANTWLRLGRVDLARQHADAVRPKDIRSNFSVGLAQALLQSELAARRGDDAVAPLRAALATMQEAAAGPVFLAAIELAIAEFLATPAQRVRLAARQLELLRPPHPAPGEATGALLALAEAQAAAGDKGFRAVALEGAALARRGRLSGTAYLPDVLGRFATLLRATDPTIAAALTLVARRWAFHAARHVPPQAQESFEATLQQLPWSDLPSPPA